MHIEHAANHQGELEDFLFQRLDRLSLYTAMLLILVVHACSRLNVCVYVRGALICNLRAYRFNARVNTDRVHLK